MTETELIIKESGLVYLTDSYPGISRKGKPGNFHYLDKDRKQVKDERVLKRIATLVLPPAWTSVWISPKANSHLQATGMDAAGRKQYKYHPEWVQRRSDSKYFRLLEFSKALPNVRRRLEKDLRRPNLNARKVLAVCVDLLQRSLIRVGAKNYLEQHSSVGLSTLKDKHVKIEGYRLRLSFTGKKGVRQELKLTDRRLARLVKKCKEIPGQELFQYFAEDGQRRSVGSGQINDYIKEISGSDFTAKDFRTWGGTLEALQQFSVCYKNQDERTKAKIEVHVLDCVAKKLGNTRAICKSSYVYPLLLASHRDGTLEKWLKRMKTDPAAQAIVLENNERVLRSFLRHHAALPS